MLIQFESIYCICFLVVCPNLGSHEQAMLLRTIEVLSPFHLGETDKCQNSRSRWARCPSVTLEEQIALQGHQRGQCATISFGLWDLLSIFAAQQLCHHACPLACPGPVPPILLRRSQWHPRISQCQPTWGHCNTPRVGQPGSQGLLIIAVCGWFF